MVQKDEISETDKDPSSRKAMEGKGCAVARFIGIRHRVKKTAEGEARPTQVAIRQSEDDPSTSSGQGVKTYDLEDETAELDFLLGKFPISWRPVETIGDVNSVPSHHVKIRKKKGLDEEVTCIPETYEGLRGGDKVAMLLGGSGDRFAAALSRRGEEVGAKVYRVPSSIFGNYRKEEKKDKDHFLLASLLETDFDLFQELTPRDRKQIRVKEAYFSRREAQLARMGCGQRLRQRLIGQVFLSEEGRYPEGSIEDEYDRLRASDPIFLALMKEEKKRESELKEVVHELDVWTEVFEPVEGCGEVLAGGLISAIGDIRRFRTDAKFKAFCGVHVLTDGRFARRRRGDVSNWSPLARQMFYLFVADQCNKRSKTTWGMKLREYKAKFRAKYPVPVEIEAVKDGKRVKVKRYTDGHIHKMAIWRTATKFAEWLWREWTRCEARHAEPKPDLKTAAVPAQ